jgi:hypothetical protein
LAAALVLAGLGAWFFSGSRAGPDAPAPRVQASSPASPDEGPPRAQADCRAAPAFAAAADQNRLSLSSLPWAPFGRPETGWEIYAPFVAREVGVSCGPTETGFAEALARWQAANGRPATGVLTAEDFDLMRIASHRRRPFVAAFEDGCPPAADPARLAPARPDEGYAGKAVSLRSDVLDAYRRLVAAARAEVPEARADPRLLTLVSGYRGPEEEAARCAGRDCSGPARVRCSPHRTGTAIDLFVGMAPGSAPASTEDANRLHQSRTPTYRWLVSNAERFGFAPYIFEPWHWEWVGAR